MFDATFEYVAISVADLEKQRVFYAQAFGLRHVVASLTLPDLGVRTLILAADHGLQVELIEKHGARSRPPMDAVSRASDHGYTHLALRVDDLDAAVAAVREAGGSVLGEAAAAQRPGVRFAFTAHPEGNLLELVAGT
jgi:catechol 2,3-dioxygenase-like lactoylglutathione lyase family enzyme